MQFHHSRNQGWAAGLIQTVFAAAVGLAAAIWLVPIMSTIVAGLKAAGL